VSDVLVQGGDLEGAGYVFTGFQEGIDLSTFLYNLWVLTAGFLAVRPALRGNDPWSDFAGLSERGRIGSILGVDDDKKNALPGLDMISLRCSEDL